MSAEEFEVLRLDIPCTAKYLQVVRLAVAGAASRADLTVDDIEGLKLAVGEACNNVIEHAFDETEMREGRARIKIAIHVRKGEVWVDVEDEGRGFDPKHVLANLDDRIPPPNESGLGIYIMRNSVDDLEIESAPGSGTRVRIVKRVSR